MGLKSKSFFPFVAGAILGVLAGFLLAPRSGTETRKKMADAARKAADKIKDTMKPGSENQRGHV